MSAPVEPTCGLYRTLKPVGQIPAGRLVQFHNHGPSGPAIYLPKSWSLNQATFQRRGVPVPGAAAMGALQPLLSEGLYRVREPFFCCAKRCQRFEAEQLVQLGYDSAATPILFVPELSDRGLGFPNRGTPVEPKRLARLARLLVPRHETPPGAVQ